MDTSTLLVDIDNPTELFIFIFTFALYGILIFLNYKKRQDVIVKLRPHFKPGSNPKVLVKILEQFNEVQKQYRKSIMNRLLIMYAVHLVLYIVYIVAEQGLKSLRAGALIFGFFLIGISIIAVQYIYSRKIQG